MLEFKKEKLVKCSDKDLETIKNNEVETAIMQKRISVKFEKKCYTIEEIIKMIQNTNLDKVKHDNI